ncbi:MAG TPA: hypothetical protein VGJ26_08035 [Pirellulales bacterium]|jgi:hypothetical protein
MAEDRGVLRQVAWTELFPWLALGRSFRLAIQARLLLLAAAGILATAVGWMAIGSVFDVQRLPPHWNADQNAWHRPEPVDLFSPAPAPDEPVSPLGWLAKQTGPLAWPWQVLSSPFQEMFAAELTLTGFTAMLLCGLWATAVWGFFGGVITRLVTLQFTHNDRASLGAAVRFVRARYGSYVAAPLFPLFGVLLLSLPVMIISLIGHAGAGGMAMLGVIWPLFLIIGLALTIFIVGLAFGWPLMWPTISTEGTDSFDALSRSYSYVYQRPLYFAFLIVVTGLLAAIGGAFVSLFASAVLYLTAWAVSWGAGKPPFSPDALNSLYEDYPTAVRLISFWGALVSLLVVGYFYSFFFTASVIIYHLLRHDVDGAEMDEVYLDPQEEKYGLPQVTTDENGVPVVADEAAPVAAANSGAPPAA